MTTEQLNLRQYMQLAMRRKWWFILPFTLVLGLSMTVTFLLPAVYLSKATILVEAQDIPQDFVRTTVTGYIEERLQTITQIVLSRKNMLQIMDQFGLYDDLRDTLTSEELVAKMRENITVDPIQTESLNPLSGRLGTVTVAFTLTFEGTNPEKVANVVNTLCALFLEENLRSRSEKARTAYEFLESQRDSLRFEIQDLEQRIANFKSENLLALPELMELNLLNLDRLQKEIDTTEKFITQLMDRKIYLQGQLAGIEPSSYTYSADGKRLVPSSSLAEDVKRLRGEYLSMKAAHTDKHPDVIRLKNQLDALETEYGERQKVRSALEELEEKRNEYRLARAKYSDKHPTVRRLKQEVEELDAQVDTAGGNGTAMASMEKEQPENPAYISLRTQVASTDMEIRTARQKLKSLSTKYEDYVQRIENTPRVEQEYSALQRDYKNAQIKYQETEARLQAAREAKGLEESRMGEKLTLVEPPQVPEKPFKPNRPALLMIGFVLSVVSGLGAGGLVEFMDKSVYTADELSSATGMPVLVTIPYLETVFDRRRKLRKRLVWILASLLLVGSLVAGWHFFREPLDVTWYRVVRKIDTLF